MKALNFNNNSNLGTFDNSFPRTIKQKQTQKTVQKFENIFSTFLIFFLQNFSTNKALKNLLNQFHWSKV